MYYHLKKEKRKTKTSQLIKKAVHALDSVIGGCGVVGQRVTVKVMSTREAPDG